LQRVALAGNVAEIRLLASIGVDANTQSETGVTALHVAASRGVVEAVKALVELSANIHAKTDLGARPLHLAAANGQGEGAGGARRGRRREA
jgi:ankyrin repeat protein